MVRICGSGGGGSGGSGGGGEADWLPRMMTKRGSKGTKRTGDERNKLGTAERKRQAREGAGGRSD